MKRITSERLVSFAVQVSTLVGVGVVLVMMTGIVLDILMRSLLNQPIPGMVEFAESLMVAVVFLCLVAAEGRGEHVTVRLFVSHFPESLQRFAFLVAKVITLAFLIFFLFQTSQEAIHSMQIGEFRWGNIRFPMWPARLTIPVGVAAYIMVIVIGMYPAFRSWPAKRRK